MQLASAYFLPKQGLLVAAEHLTIFSDNFKILRNFNHLLLITTYQSLVTI